MDCVIACGVEMMSRVPIGSDSPFLDEEKSKKMKSEMNFKILHQGQSAELMAEKWGLKRSELEEFAVESHKRAANATKNGYFKREIFPVTVVKEDGSKTVLDKDEGIRYSIDAEKMKELKPVFKTNGVITAAVSSQISDGASAVLLMSGSKLRKLGIKPRARIVSCVSVGTDPELMLTGPIPATQKALQRAQLSLKDISAFEINEAFASVVLAWQKDLGVDPKKTNPNGGAIAHGHPLGATGCILMTKLVHELERTGGRYGLQTMCLGFGMGTATVIENLSGPKSSL